MKQILPVLFMLISSLCATSQAMARRLNVWALSDSTGVDFNNGAPAAIKTSLNTQEGVASVCDHNGELLFYTDGSSLWDRTHRLAGPLFVLGGVATILASLMLEPSHAIEIMLAGVFVPAVVSIVYSWHIARKIGA